MKAAVVAQAGSSPVYSDFPAPLPSSGECSIAVSAAALSPVVKARVSGAHYSAAGDFPFVAGIDGVGRLDDGRRVYFILPKAPYGSMAERAVVPASHCVPVPDGLDDIAAAALANPGLSSWAAFKERARLASGETVLINGATGVSGRLAVQIAKHLGARKVIATGRNASALQSLKAIGADETILLGEDSNALDAAIKDHFARRHRRGARLSVGEKRRADSHCRNQGRQGGRSNSLRPDRQCQRRDDHLAGLGTSFGADRAHGQRSRQRAVRSHCRSDCGNVACSRRRWLSNCHQDRSLVGSRTGMARRGLRSRASYSRLAGSPDNRILNILMPFDMGQNVPKAEEIPACANS